jgi:catechol O-methyltransferase
VNYVSLPPSEHIVAATGLAFTRTFAEKYNLTGQIAFDFIRSDIDHEIYAIECNPRTHTAIVLYRNFPAHPSTSSQSEWVRAYTHGTLSPAAADAALARNGGNPLVPARAQGPVYWVGHEVFDAARFVDWRTLVHRLLFEFEGHWDEQDPLPWFALYHVQWPMVFALSLLNGRRWTRINASTGKVFWC